MLPDLKEGMKCSRRILTPKQHFTQPPPRYTEARLVKTLEELGIGRPSTYAPTLDTIQKRGYVALDNKRSFRRTWGNCSELILEFFPDILDVEFTAKMEQDLDNMEDGKIRWVKIIDEFYQGFAKHLEIAEKEMQSVEIKDEPAGEDCEHCGNPMVFKMGRYGKFMACSNFPDCRNTKPIVKEIGVTCPTCKEGQIIERRSKKKRLFYGCTIPGMRIYLHGINHYQEAVLNVKGYLLRRSLKKGVQVQCVKCDYKEEPQS